MAKFTWCFLCVKDTGEVDFIAAYSPKEIIDEYGDIYVSIIRQFVWNCSNTRYKLIKGKE